MATVISRASASYNAGTRQLLATNTQPYTNVAMTFTRESWPLTTSDEILFVDLERSTDGGNTWQYVGGASFSGGTITDKFGNVQATCGADFSYLQNGQPTQLTGVIRATIRNTARLTTAITVDAT